MSLTTRSLRSGAALAAAALVLAACGGGSEADAPQASSSVDVGSKIPDHAPAEDVLAAAADEDSVLVYGNANDDMMQPLIKAFSTKYPDITVKYLTLDGAEVFQRYQTEEATGTRTADLLVESGGSRWLDLIDKGEVIDYDEPNLEGLPDYAESAPGVFALSMGSVVAVYNKALVPEAEQPTTLAEFAEFSEKYKGKIGTYEIENQLNYGAVQAYLSASGEEGWDVLAKIGKNAKTESGAGALMTKVGQGAYVAAYNVSDAVVPLSVAENPEIFSARHLTDNAVVVPQSIGLTKAAESPNGAKVFINYLLSNEGQEIGCRSGVSAYRPGIACPEDFGLAAEADSVGGMDKLIISQWTPELGAQRDEITTRWNELFGK